MGSVNDDEDQVAAVLHAVGEYFEVQKKMTAVKDFSFAHPVLTLFSLVMVAMCSIPIICFFTFFFGSIFLAVTGFVLIEGTILTIATVFLGIALLVVGSVAIGLSAIIVAGFLAFDTSYNLLKKVSDRNTDTSPCETLKPGQLKTENKIK